MAHTPKSGFPGRRTLRRPGKAFLNRAGCEFFAAGSCRKLVLRYHFFLPGWSVCRDGARAMGVEDAANDGDQIGDLERLDEVGDMVLLDQHA